MKSRHPSIICASAIAIVLLATAAAQRWTIAQTTSQSAKLSEAFAPVSDQKHLDNAHIVTDKVISGAQPDDEAAFQALRDLGIKTIISVDGARPNAELAHKYGMRYVHLPIGYDDVPAERGKEIAKAIEEMPGPIYVHCHHGKHRSAAAVAVACVMNGQLKPEQAESVLTTFGTGANYIGLWQAARDARPVDSQTLESLNVTFVEYTKINALAEFMVSVDERFDHLKLAQKIGWATPKDHPDIDPAHEALMLQEHFHEIRRLDDVASRPDDFRKWMLESEDASKLMHEALKAAPTNAEAANAAFNRVNTSCTSCHKAYRD